MIGRDELDTPQFANMTTELMKRIPGAHYDRIEYSKDGYKISRRTINRFDESKAFGYVSPKAGASVDLDDAYNSVWVGYGQGFVCWTGAHWSWWAHVLSLTGEKYAERVSCSTGGREYDVGIPRTFYMGLSYQW